MKTVTEWFRELEGWRRERCCSCGGHGMTSAYSGDGGDFLGAQECRCCAGTGRTGARRGAIRALPRRAVLLSGGCHHGDRSTDARAAALPEAVRLHPLRPAARPGRLRSDLDALLVGDAG